MKTCRLFILNENVYLQENVLYLFINIYIDTENVLLELLNLNLEKKT